MIHEAFKITYIAHRYYKIKHPERGYDAEAARKQFMQDKHIDGGMLWKAIKEVFKEQFKMLNK